MMLWNLIYQFYVMYIFGGWFNGYQYNALIGAYETEEGIFTDVSTNDINVLFLEHIGDSEYPFYLSFGNYLSLIATIITLIVILLVCFHIIKKCFNVFTRIL